MATNYKQILDKLVDGEIKKYRVEPKKAFAFQKALRDYGRRQNIQGHAQRGGTIVYTASNSKK